MSARRRARDPRVMTKAEREKYFAEYADKVEVARAKARREKRGPETKAITIRVSTRLANATLRVYAEEAARLIVLWAKAGATANLAPIVDDPGIALVARPRVEAVGSR